MGADGRSMPRVTSSTELRGFAPAIHNRCLAASRIVTDSSKAVRDHHAKQPHAWTVVRAVFDLATAMLMGNDGRLFVVPVDPSCLSAAFLLALALSVLSGSWAVNGVAGRGHKPDGTFAGHLAGVYGLFRGLPMGEHHIHVQLADYLYAFEVHVRAIPSHKNDAWTVSGRSCQGAGVVANQNGDIQTACVCQLPSAYVSASVFMWPSLPSKQRKRALTDAEKPVRPPPALRVETVDLINCDTDDELPSLPMPVFKQEVQSPLFDNGLCALADIPLDDESEEWIADLNRIEEPLSSPEPHSPPVRTNAVIYASPQQQQQQHTPHPHMVDAMTETLRLVRSITPRQLEALDTLNALVLAANNERIRIAISFD